MPAFLDRLNEGLIDESRRRKLPKYPLSIGILTSVPSSALADILRTAKERWPLTKLFIFPIPVQGEAAKNTIIAVLDNLSKQHLSFGLEAQVLARGAGSRDDLVVFDNE